LNFIDESSEGIDARVPIVIEDYSQIIWSVFQSYSFYSFLREAKHFS
jgi:hypothetical protein